ncbi:MAG: hypothetical protein ABSD59_24470 [Terracidiphilus sp.]
MELPTPQEGTYLEAYRQAMRWSKKNEEAWWATIRARKQFIGMLKSWADYDL